MAPSRDDHARGLIAAWCDGCTPHHCLHTSRDGLTPWECRQRSAEGKTLNRANHGMRSPGGRSPGLSFPELARKETQLDRSGTRAMMPSPKTLRHRMSASLGLGARPSVHCLERSGKVSGGVQGRVSGPGWQGLRSSMAGRSCGSGRGGSPSSAREARVHAVLRPTRIQHGAWHAIFAALIGSRTAAFHLVQQPHDPGLGETGLRDRNPHGHPAGEIVLPSRCFPP